MRAPKPKAAKEKLPGPAHARDVVAAWCEVYRAALQEPYTVTGREAGQLARLAADYVTGDEWEAKLARLRAGMARYAEAPDRWPPGPPTVGGFARDPARWIGRPEARPRVNGRSSGDRSRPKTFAEAFGLAPGADVLDVPETAGTTIIIHGVTQ